MTRSNTDLQHAFCIMYYSHMSVRIRCYWIDTTDREMIICWSILRRRLHAPIDNSVQWVVSFHVHVGYWQYIDYRLKTVPYDCAHSWLSFQISTFSKEVQ